MSASELGRAKLSHNEWRMSIVSFAHDIMSASEENANKGKQKGYIDEKVETLWEKDGFAAAWDFF